MNKFIVWLSQAEQREIIHLYEETKRFRGVIGMIDGTHIPIKAPLLRPADYYNGKDFHSVILQGVVREDMRFVDVYSGWPGKVHDTRVFKNSPLFERGEEMCRMGYLLGDGGYPVLPWLLTPLRFTGNLTPTQKKYNSTMSSIRVTVERVFGLLK